MKFFNLDLHISVIADIKKIFNDLGHQVDNWSISGHAHLMGKPLDKVDIINQNTWRNIDKIMVDQFYERYKGELETYDGFIVTHTPCFSLLYEKFDKPIITVASTRYEEPFSNDMLKWAKFNKYLQSNIDSGKIIPITNNKYDKKYTELFTDREWEYIPSLCEYTDCKYTGKIDKFLYSSKFKAALDIKKLVDKDLVLQKGYEWQDVADFKGVVHVPYNVSTMSISEQYTANIPLFFPSYDFLSDLRSQFFNAGVLSETSWNQVHGLSSNSSLFAGSQDPNNYMETETMMKWAKLSDFYDEENMPYIQYFHSFEHLRKLLDSSNIREISNNMKTKNKIRKEMVYNKWKEVLRNIEA